MYQRHLAAVLGTLGFAQLILGQPATVKRPIFDPVLQRNAFFVNVPQNWQFDGAMVPGTMCESFPTAVFRASSPDGLTGVYVLPRLDWSWATGLRQNPPTPEGCLPWTQNRSAKEILTYMVPILKVAFDREAEPALIAQLNAQAKASVPKNSHLTFYTDADRFVVRYEIDHHPVEEVLDASVTCSDDFDRPSNTHVHKCGAYVRRLRAPLGRLQESAPTLTSVRGSFDEQWYSQWMDVWARAMRARINGLYDAQTKALLAAGQQAGDARMREHEAYMNSMQRQQNVRNYNFVVGQYNKQHATDDFVDYILDCTRLQGGGRVVSIGNNCPNRQTAP